MEMRAMQPSNWPAVRTIHEQGIVTRQATFETEPSSWEESDAGSIHRRCGFRIVGTRERIARLGGTCRDTVLLERRRP
jgi:L-amino acid N-acyltransferase YncA